VSVDNPAGGGSDVHVVDGEVRVSCPTRTAPVAYRARDEWFITGGQLLPHEIYARYQSNALPYQAQ